MNMGGKYWFRGGFSRYKTLYGKKCDLSKKKVRLSRAVARKFVSRLHYAGAFLYGKISNSNIDKSCDLKSCGHSLEINFVLRFFKILSANGAHRPRRSKKGQKTRNFKCFFEILREVHVQNPEIIACWMRLIIFYKKKIILDIF
jgi:hypothetical protein